jgi:drug/metabolite transporter (DMT)-like permease
MRGWGKIVGSLGLAALGVILILAGMQRYEEGSCAAGDCRFDWRLDDPVFVIVGALCVVGAVVLYLYYRARERREFLVTRTQGSGFHQ